MQDHITGVVAAKRINLGATRPGVLPSSSGTYLLQIRFTDPTSGFAAERDIPCSPGQYYRCGIGDSVTLRRVGWSGVVEWVIDE